MLLALLIVPGVIGFELWPLTAWRLFSLSRDADQTEWALHVVTADGVTQPVDLEELPLAYRNAAWPLAELPGASEARQREVCAALLVGVRDVVSDARTLTLVRQRAHLDVVDGESVISTVDEDIEQCS